MAINVITSTTCKIRYHYLIQGIVDVGFHTDSLIVNMYIVYISSCDENKVHMYSPNVW